MFDVLIFWYLFSRDNGSIFSTATVPERDILPSLCSLWGLSDLFPLPEGRRHLWHTDCSTSYQNVNTAFASSFLVNPNAENDTISASPSLFSINSGWNLLALRHIWYCATSSSGGRETFRIHVVFTQYRFSLPLPCSCSDILIALFEAHLIFSLYQKRGDICDGWILAEWGLVIQSFWICVSEVLWLYTSTTQIPVRMKIDVGSQIVVWNLKKEDDDRNLSAMHKRGRRCWRIPVWHIHWLTFEQIKFYSQCGNLRSGLYGSVWIVKSFRVKEGLCCVFYNMK